MKTSALRTTFVYTSARIIMFGASVLVLFWAGARGLLLLGLALIISALLSYVLLNKQRTIIADKLNGRLSRVGSKASEFSKRLDEGAALEDADDDEAEVTSTPSTSSRRTRKSPSSASRRRSALRPSQPPRVSWPSTAATASCRETSDVSITTSASSGSS